jgi:sugar phosphate isomerase/epimerase
MPRCQLVQLSDYCYGDRSLPARAVPGDGVIPLQRLVSMLLDVGYAGAFELELLGPRVDTEGHLAATTRAASHISELLSRLGA